MSFMCSCPLDEEGEMTWLEVESVEAEDCWEVEELERLDFFKGAEDSCFTVE